MASKKATITVEWGYDQHSITLTERNWARVKTGKPLSIRGKGYWYEGDFFWDYWHFAGGLGEELRVDYGDDGGCGFRGALSGEYVQEHA